MNKHIYILVFLISLSFISCDSELVDFSEVTNPQLSEENVIGQPNSTSSWLAGVKARMAFVSNESVTMSEIASDNYVNTQTFYNQQLDNLTISIQDTDMNNLQFDIARLRESALYGINSVAPNDVNATDDQIAELYFYEGISYLLAGEYYSFLPAEVGGIPLSSSENYELAINSFNKAIGLSGSNLASYHLALARTYYNLGDKINAIASATESLNLNDESLFQIEFDEANGPSSEIEDALFERGTFDDLQPLPSLDFLDPKYSFLNTSEDQPVSFLKAEEAYLILAEAYLSDGDFNKTKESLLDLITLINRRATRTIDDSSEGRDQDNPGSRPNNSLVTISYMGSTESFNNLVIDRNNSVTVPIISGTSITSTVVNNTANDVDELLEMIYLMRQQIFIAEGRRIVDLGVKYVISENELLLNSNIDDTHPGLTGVIPPFIDAIKTELDEFSYDTNSNSVVIKHNVNSILVSNKNSDLVIPFF